MKKIIAYLMSLTVCVSMMSLSCITAVSGEEISSGNTETTDGSSEVADDKNESDNKQEEGTAEDQPDETKWHLSASKAAEAELTEHDDYYQVHVINPGGAANGGVDRWDLQFRIRGISIEEGHKYKLTYNISSDSNGYCYSKIGNKDSSDVGAAVAGEAWHNQFGKSTVKSYANGYILWNKAVDYSTGWNMQPISYGDTLEVTSEFDGIATIPDAEWTFFLGGKGSSAATGCFEKDTNVLFTNLSLTDLTTNEVMVSYNHHDEASEVTGDIDGNGTTDLNDLLLLSQYLLKEKDLDENQVKAADVNNNGEAAIEDLAVLRSIIMQGNI